MSRRRCWLRAEALERYEDELRTGSWSDAVLAIAFGGTSPAEQRRGQIAVEVYSGRALAPDRQPTPDGAAAADWYRAWTEPSNHIEIWLSSTLASLAPVLGGHGTVRLCETPVPWLDRPDRLARALGEV